MSASKENMSQNLMKRNYDNIVHLSFPDGSRESPSCVPKGIIDEESSYQVRVEEAPFSKC